MTRRHHTSHRKPGLRIAVLAHLHHAVASPFAGGLEAHTAQAVAALADRGHDVVLFAKEGSHVVCRQVAVLDGRFRVNGYPDSVSRDRQHRVLDGAMRSAVRAARRGFDVVLNNSLSPVPHRELRGVPTLHVFHTPPLPRIVDVFGGAGWEPDPRHAYVSVSETNARGWRPHLPALGVVHNGIPLRQWTAGPARRTGQAVWTGRITPEKGAHVAIEAARLAGMELVLAGPIHDPEYFSVLIEPELGASVRYAGHLDHAELRQLVSGSEVFVASPLWDEPFGLNVVEALACGTPVAALPAGAMAEIIAPGAGFVASRSDAASLAAAIASARGLSHDVVADSARRFSVETMAEHYEALMHRLVGMGSAARQPRAADPAGETADEPAGGH